MQRPRLRVQGLKRGVEVVVKLWGVGEVMISADGEYELRKCNWLLVTCNKVCKSVLCDVMETPEEAHAVSGT
jgi:hypothetical protein